MDIKAVRVESGETLNCKRSRLKTLDFHLMQACTNSSQKIVASIFAEELDDCKQASSRLQGLAFNFVDVERITDGRENCIIYECPEFNVTSLKQFDSVYHYYSAYAKIWPPENMTCVPKEGLYVFTKEKLNYTEAVDKCEEYGGALINVVTEEATNRAANVLAKSTIAHISHLQAYVGLDDIEQEGKFFNLCGEPLNKIPFRAWAPGEPKSKYDNEDCVTIDSFRHWRVQPCNKELPFICEILPNGPLNLTEAYCTAVEDMGAKKECYDYYSSAEIEVENETCERKSEEHSNANEQKG